MLAFYIVDDDVLLSASTLDPCVGVIHVSQHAGWRERLARCLLLHSYMAGGRPFTAAHADGEPVSGLSGVSFDPDDPRDRRLLWNHAT